MAFGRDLMVLGLLILVLGALWRCHGGDDARWPRTAATDHQRRAVAPDQHQPHLDGRSFEDGWNSFHVLYQYRVGNREHVAGGVEPYDFGMQNSAGAAKMRERHPSARKRKSPTIRSIPLWPISSRGRLVALALSGIGAFMLLVGWSVRKGRQGIGTMNEEGATERIAKSIRDGLRSRSWRAKLPDRIIVVDWEA